MLYFALVVTQWALWGVLEGCGWCRKVGEVGSTLPLAAPWASARAVPGGLCTSTLRATWLKGSGLSGKSRTRSANVPSPEWTFSADTQAVWEREIISFAPWISFLRREWGRLCGPSPHTSLWNPLKWAYADAQKLKPELLSSVCLRLILPWRPCSYQ